MADPETQDEPSMEEILASIRRIISEDGEEGEEAAAAAPGDPAPEPVAEESAEQASEPEAEASSEPDDVLELTEEVDEVDAIFAEESPDPEPEPEPDPEAAAKVPDVAMQEPVAPETPVAPEAPLVSDPALGDAAGTLQQLGQMITPPSIDPNEQRVTPGGRTIEDHVLEMLRPMLKEWLDQNLPPLVQRLVQREVDRIVHRSDPL